MKLESVGFSFLWTVIERFGYSGFLFITTLILARLISPDDFGLVGSVSVIIGFSQVLIDSGLGGALIRKKHVYKDDYNTVFTINLLISLILYGIIFSFSYFINILYSNPILESILKVLSLSLVFSSLSITTRVFLIKNQNYKAIAISSVGAIILSSFISIVLASLGYGVWALVFLTTNYHLFFLILSRGISSFKNSLSISKKSFLSIYKFGGSLLGSSLLQILVNEGLTTLIAKRHKFQVTGFYYQAKKIIDFPVSVLRSIGDAFIFPMLSKIEDDQQFTKSANELTQIILLISAPIFSVSFFYSEGIVLLLLGEKWIGSNIILKILSISGIFLVAEGINRNIIKAKGKPSVILKSEIIKKVIDISFIVVFIRYSLTLLLVSLVLSNIFAYAINLHYLKKECNYHYRIQIRTLLSIIVVSILCGLFTLWINTFFYFDIKIWKFILSSLIYLLVYILVCFIIYKERMLKMYNFIVKI